MPELVIKDLHVTVEGKEILKGIDLVVRSGEVHAIMGPNGSGKSTLALTVMGHPRYKVTRGEITYGGRDVIKMAVDERARAGLFLAFQYPAAIPGVSVANFLRTAINARRAEPGVTAGTAAEARKNDMPIPQFVKLLKEKMELLQIDDSYKSRSVNDGFSGGEKKRLETLQMHMFGPTLALMDETDSGLDIDALRIVAGGVNALRKKDRSMLVITHYQRLLDYIVPDRVHVLAGGRIVKTGGKELALELEKQGYAWLEDAENAPPVVSA